ncbi:hypothetical protein [Nocardia aobensis]|uniref:hypothetical protein n=1 Tax=Nocardia aobensis TaxID=257277 RepID=UPI0006882A72|nr:hypothetical protein [Nocardia aobensis]
MKAERLVEESFELVARVRRARVFHPNGLWFSGHLRPAPAFERYFGGGQRDVEVRLSKALGMPGRVPDAVGIGLRVRTPGGRWDLALASTPTGTLTRFFAIPVPSWRHATYGTLMAYRFDGGAPQWIFARPDADQPADASLATLRDYTTTHGLGFTLTAARLNGPEEPFANLRLTAETAAPPPEDAVDPTLHHPPGVALAPRFITRIRRSAYRGSREGRGAEPSPGHPH